MRNACNTWLVRQCASCNRCACRQYACACVCTSCLHRTIRGRAQTRKKREVCKFWKAAPAGRTRCSHRQSSHPSESAVLKTTEQVVLEPKRLQLLHCQQTSQRQSGLLSHGRPAEPCRRPSCPPPRASQLKLAGAALVGRLLTGGLVMPAAPLVLPCD